MKRLLAFLLLTACCRSSERAAEHRPTLYVSHLENGWLSAFHIDELTGALRPVDGSPFQVCAGMPDALVFHPSLKGLFAAAGRVYVAARDASGPLTRLSPEEGSYRTQSRVIDLAIHPNGRFLYAVSSGEGVVARVTVLAVTVGSGTLTPVGDLVPLTGIAQAAAIDPSGQSLYCVTHGGAAIEGFKVDPDQGALSPEGRPQAVKETARRLRMHPSGDFLYALSSGNFDGSISAYQRSRFSGWLSPVAHSPFLLDKIASDFAITPDGRFLYATFPGADYVRGYAIDSMGALSLLPAWFRAGQNPYALSIDPSGKFLYVSNYESQDISGFLIKEDGNLVPLTESKTPVGYLTARSIITPLPEK